MRLMDPFIIADIGSNWKRANTEEENLTYGYLSIDEAKRAGASAVKFQFFTHKDLYGVQGDDTYALPEKFLAKLKAHADKKEIEFMCTAFSVHGYERVNKLVNRHKIASSENRHPLIIDFCRSSKKETLISLGGLSEDEFLKAQGYSGFIPLECVLSYPAPFEAYNLSLLIGKSKWGVSDHCLSPALPLMALAMGARYFEVHFDALPDLQPTPDSAVSINPMGLKNYCDAIKQAMGVLRPRVKRIEDCERENVMRYKRRFITTSKVKKGDPFEYQQNFEILRPTYTMAYHDPLVEHFPAKRCADKDYDALESVI